MQPYINSKLVEKIMSESGVYSDRSKNLLISYIRTVNDILTIDNRSVEMEVLDVLYQNLLDFRTHVPRAVRKTRHVSELIREIENLVYN